RGLPNSLGKWFLTVEMELDAASGSFRKRTIREGTRMLLLLEISEKLHGALPKRLADLNSLFRGISMPTDFFAGGPFHYSRTKRIFWSVGKDGVDNGGTMGRGRHSGPDIVWTIP